MNRLTPGFLLSERYRLAEQVAAGGMAQVWAAVDEVLQRTVAVKIMHPQTLEQRAMTERFRAEAIIAAQISHPNIVEVFDFAEHEGLAFLVMEFINGPTLAELLADVGRLPSERVRVVLVQLAGALGRAHENGIIHRDLKPSNVAISPDGYAKLMDFGIAKDMNGASLTGAGEIFGTAYYISPEQALGEVLTPASDLYSLGVLGHELLTGAKPFDRGTPIATALAHVEQPPPPLPDDVPADLFQVITACLAKDAKDRPTASGVVSALAGEPGEGQQEPAAVPSATTGADAAPRRAYPDEAALTQQWAPVWRHVDVDGPTQPQDEIRTNAG
ncbi:MAG TPA: serine/threonine-protein kinase [Propionicimonas sp.]|jgi:serine/threonine-protein kinase|uniref:serine/threonine-protein kinase n=1 Tax=Propionicimonas sp. TaxID=1955623 RepID=UPI002F42B9A1